MVWTVTKIRRALGGRLVGNIQMRSLVCKSLLFLPDKLIERIAATVWFISSPQDAWALTFKGSELTKRHLIFLSDELFWQSDAQISYTILHEIGHVVLDHRNSIGYEQTESEIKQQEKDADLFAKKYLRLSSEVSS